MECDLCLNSFDRSKRQPYVLIPCSHTYCHDCLIKLKLKQCKSCSQQIDSINKNWILIKLIPESDYDHLKANTNNALKETSSARCQYDDMRSKNFAKIKKQIIDFKDEIPKRYKELIERVHVDYQILMTQLSVIEEKLNKDYFDYSYENDTLATKLSEFEKIISSNQLDDIKLKILLEQINQLKFDLNRSIESENKLDNYSFIHNKKILCEKNLIGEILNKL